MDELGCPNVMILPMNRRNIFSYLALTLETASRVFAIDGALEGRELLSLENEHHVAKWRPIAVGEFRHRLQRGPSDR
ncbi:hypothetical protein [Bradyrhizobium sp. DASA03120]|uniref:hypothetical protein n=1 Tax=Bradyrhizobium sp. SMVTL-02 TaxID=3395917 RepID=UPI003F70F298